MKSKYIFSLLVFISSCYAMEHQHELHTLGQRWPLTEHQIQQSGLLSEHFAGSQAPLQCQQYSQAQIAYLVDLLSILALPISDMDKISQFTSYKAYRLPFAADDLNFYQIIEDFRLAEWVLQEIARACIRSTKDRDYFSHIVKLIRTINSEPSDVEEGIVLTPFLTKFMKLLARAYFLHNHRTLDVPVDYTFSVVEILAHWTKKNYNYSPFSSGYATNDDEDADGSAEQLRVNLSNKRIESLDQLSLALKKAGEKLVREFRWPVDEAGIEYISHINLANNRISRLPKRAFEGCSKLRFINLHSNPLTAIDPEAFDGLTQPACVLLPENMGSIVINNSLITKIVDKTYFASLSAETIPYTGSYGRYHH